MAIGDVGDGSVLGAETLGEDRAQRQVSAAEQRRLAQQHVAHSDVAGAGYIYKRERSVALILVLLLTYACAVALVAFNFNLPIGHTWLEATVPVVLILLTARLVRMRRIRGRLLPR